MFEEVLNLLQGKKVLVEYHNREYVGFIDKHEFVGENKKGESISFIFSEIKKIEICRGDIPSVYTI